MVTLVAVIGNSAKEMDKKDYQLLKIMLTVLKIQVSNPLKRTFRLLASSCKSLAETASFRGINKACLGIRIGVSVISFTSNEYISVKNL